MNIKRILLQIFLSFFLGNLAFAQNQNSVAGDRLALEDLYDSTNGTHWNNDDGWLIGNPSNSWYGVKVDAKGRVVSLNLSDNNLTGTLLQSLGNLTKLKYLNVKQNRLTGSIPWAGIGNMRALSHLLLNGRSVDPNPRVTSHHPGKDINGSWSDERTNNFTGMIGPEVGNLVNLEQLELMGVNSNQVGLTGPIPAEIGNLTKMEGLFLDYNNLSSLPESMSKLVNLIQFSITRNHLQAHCLPTWMANWEKMKYLWLGENNIGGRIPDLSSLTKLRILILRKNNLEGPIPDYLFDGTMPEINMVNLSYNNLTGSLPDFGRPNNLKALQLNGNHLTGPIPESISNLPKMINLSLGWNALEGEIPDLSHMYHLRYFRANDNNLTGNLPMIDTSNKDLKFLHFQNNRLSGNIHPEFAKLFLLPKFENLNISNNNFSDVNMQPFIQAVNIYHDSSILEYRGQKAAADTTAILEKIH